MPKLFNREMILYYRDYYRFKDCDKYQRIENQEFDII
ncbi:unnamed protein product [Paramecium pentaurelia]|uniref:Uncharacterized protein n=1 Tax=Paramecium pentaurelia TaxID=43138 RepID=A0A8S1YJH6_9CILI|nr:unnamed protein product [Paramecium pentaurelia]